MIYWRVSALVSVKVSFLYIFLLEMLCYFYCCPQSSTLYHWYIPIIGISPYHYPHARLSASDPFSSPVTHGHRSWLFGRNDSTRWACERTFGVIVRRASADNRQLVDSWKFYFHCYNTCKEYMDRWRMCR